MYLGFTFVALASLYGNIKGQRFLIDSKLMNKIFVWFVSVFFVFGAVRMLTVTHYSATTKEKLWRGMMEEKNAPPQQIRQ